MRPADAAMRLKRPLTVVAGLLSALLIQNFAPAPPNFIEIPNLASQRIEGEQFAVEAGSSGFDRVGVRVWVDTSGRVIDAQVVGAVGVTDTSLATAAARTWRFRPQVVDGRPVNASGVITIGYRLPEIPPDLTVPFPEGPLSETEITLSGTGFGVPSYTVTIAGDGSVHSVGGYPGVVGKHEGRIEPQQVAELLDRFKQAHFQGLRSSYRASITDGLTRTLTLRIGDWNKSVQDYVGRQVGMPASVTALEEAVTGLADPWLRGAGAVAGPPTPLSLITSPDWMRRPGPNDFADYYPARAKTTGTTGRVMISCLVSMAGKLTDCQILSESPQGFGFGEAALKIASFFQMKPQTKDGEPTAGGTFETGLTFAPPPQ